MTTLRDIAKRAAVSTATVSNVLNDSLYVSPQLRERVLAAARELDYRPNVSARNLRLKRTQMIGMVVPDITNPFFPAVVRGAEDTLTQAGLTLIIGNSDNDVAKEEGYYRAFLERRIDGLLTVATSDVAPVGISSLLASGVPTVYVDRFHANVAGDAVVADNKGGARECVSHLIGRGHRRIGIITGPLDLLNARERLAGYVDALREAGIKQDAALIREGRFDVASGFEQAVGLLELKRKPSAIFACNAQMAWGALQAFDDAGLGCPQQIGLSCFDNTDLLELSRPRLTCVGPRSYDLGKRGAELLLERLGGRLQGKAVRVMLPAILRVMQST